MFKKLFFSFFLFFLFTISVLGKEKSTPGRSGYFFPLKESKNLTSVFCDHRNFHFHTGIDIRTYGKTGYKVFACKSGWVFRVYCSFWGYGKGLYLKLDDRRYAVYGHLSKFAPKIERLVREKQIQRKSYKLNLFLKENQIRVKKGELVGYTGETGTGAPHLHFELRDSENRPLNPLTHGVSIPDFDPPVFRKLLIRPKDTDSFVDGEKEPKTFNFIYNREKKVYYLEQTPIVWGKIGLEVCCYDKMRNKFFGIYKLFAYLDGKLIFSSHYDTVSFEDSWMVELERDFELKREKNLNFYKLFIDEGNRLNFYQTGNTEDGLIKTYGKKESVNSPKHKLEIFVYDANGNFSCAEFFLVFNQSPEIISLKKNEYQGSFFVEGILKDDGRIKYITFEKSTPEKINWYKKEFVHPKPLDDSKDSMGKYRFLWTNEKKDPLIVRIQAEDSYGLKSDYKYILINEEKLKKDNQKEKIKLDFEYSFKDGFLKLDIFFNNILKTEPKIQIKSGFFNFNPFSFIQKDVKSYSLTFLLIQKDINDLLLLIDGKTIYGDTVSFTRPLSLSIATPQNGGEAFSFDKKAFVKIEPGVVYKSINLTIEEKDPPKKIKHKIIGNLYSFKPQDIPFSGFVEVYLFFEGEDFDPYKIAIYEYDKEKWRFVGKKLDPKDKKVSGKVRYLSDYALLEDEKSPQIRILYPKKSQRTKRRRPKIKALIYDDLSGFSSEDDIEVSLDGEWLIPEYDPEKRILISKPNSNLSYGWHNLKISAKDRMGNLKVVEAKFKVIK